MLNSTSQRHQSHWSCCASSQSFQKLPLPHNHDQEQHPKVQQSYPEPNQHPTMLCSLWGTQLLPKGEASPCGDNWQSSHGSTTWKKSDSTMTLVGSERMN
jgi:hypothetical protein